MGLIDFILSLVLVGFSLTVLGVLVWLVVAPLRSGMKGSKGSLKLRRAVTRLQTVDSLLEQQNADGALKELKKALLLDFVPGPDSIAPLREHHQNILSRLLVIAEEFGSRAENIAVIEQLFLRRTELFLETTKARHAFHKLRDRREQSGKDIPSWSKENFKSRLSSSKKELASNQKELQSEVDKLFQAIKTPTDQSITYH